MNITNLPIDVLGIIFSYVNLYMDLGLVQIVAFKKMCKCFNNAFNSPKLAHLFHGKYQKWWTGRLMRGEHLSRNPRYLRYQEKIHVPKPWCILDGNYYRDE